MLKVIRNHRRAAYNKKPEKYEELTITPQGINPDSCPEYLVKAAKKQVFLPRSLAKIR